LHNLAADGHVAILMTFPPPLPSGSHGGLFLMEPAPAETDTRQIARSKRGRNPGGLLARQQRRLLRTVLADRLLAPNA
jgi:hypothetical protein